MKTSRAALFALACAASLGLSAPAEAGSFLQCAPFARAISGIQLFGRAASWWSEAVGRYARGNLPQVGAILSFRSSRGMPAGHVAVVSQVVSAREVLLTHANWSYRGGVERNVRAVDVSPGGDWSMVRVWYGPQGGLGQRPNPANGFIYPSAAGAAQAGNAAASAQTAAADPAAPQG